MRAASPPHIFPLRIEGSLDAHLSRGLWFVKWLLAIPHFVVLAFLWIAVVVVSVIALVAILFTGRYPRSLLQALSAGRVARLILDPEHEFRVARLSSAAARALRKAADEMVAECAIELAISRGAAITVVSVDDAPALAQAGGMAATLRY